MYIQIVLSWSMLDQVGKTSRLKICISSQTYPPATYINVHDLLLFMYIDNIDVLSNLISIYLADS
jgi:hypothetical protein